MNTILIHKFYASTDKCYHDLEEMFWIGYQLGKGGNDIKKIEFQMPLNDPLSLIKVFAHYEYNPT
jgi:hypothetical protein